MGEAKKGYTRRSNAININIWHPTGEEIPDEVARELVETVDKTVKEHRLLQQVVRT